MTGLRRGERVYRHRKVEKRSEDSRVLDAWGGSHTQPKGTMERATPGEDSRRETKKQDEEGEEAG